MAELTIDYDNLQGIIDSANTLAVKAESYYESLQNDVINSFGGVTAGVNDVLESAQYYVKAKKQQLADKANEYATFAKNVGVLMAHAIQADLDVATKIENNQEDFLKNHSEIKAAEGIEALMISLCIEAKNSRPIFNLFCDATVWVHDKISSGYDALKYFYECGGGKELCQIVGAALLFAASVCILLAAFPLSLAAGLFEAIVSISAVVSGAIGVVNAFANIYTSKKALEARNGGDPAWAKIYGDTDKASDWLRLTRFDSKLGNTLSYVGADAVDTAEFVTDTISIANMANKINSLGSGEGLYKSFTGTIRGLKPNSTRLVDDIKGLYNAGFKGGFRLTKETSKYYKAVGTGLKTMQKDFDVAVGLAMSHKTLGDAFKQYNPVSRALSTSQTYKFQDKIQKTMDKGGKIPPNSYSNNAIHYQFSEFNYKVSLFGQNFENNLRELNSRPRSPLFC
ncbi:MAG: hypothetical protein IJ535_01235 [Pseudobutyrivibrio sp.]|uniref:hypothetical protein n=1 Tax=Pseudobutyrivibrio sp. TaxID=2014367 RepID=UPI0025D02661|nr:hypothetical protein [Pseudobutyrivibrio sp.]MBQ8488382.1 hypothetical protein [Pseudobutyrivibrio sp.]